VPGEHAREAYAEQIAVLADAGADLIAIETQTDLSEMEAALAGARTAAPDLAVLVTATFTHDDRTLLGSVPQRVAAALAERSIAGLIVPDMPAVEGGALRAACDAAGVALVPLVAPTTRPEDVKAIGAMARGFVYVVSVMGVTGERSGVSAALGEVVQRVRAACDLPIAVGFGVATAEQARQVGELADGVIIGSRLVRAIADAPDLDEGLAELRAFLADARAALAQDEAPSEVQSSKV
jgi:tryptophan synthase alpha chain